jgi:hypothetical protein
MEQANLSATDVASISKALHGRSMERGTQILGSQLGVILNQALHPKTTRAYGGLRALVESDLKHLVRYVGPDANSTDLVFALEASTSSPQLPDPITSPVEVAGAELWRSFSNPKILSRLACNSAGVLMAFPDGHTCPDGFGELQRPTAENYRDLAKSFATSLSEHPAADRLRATLELEDFYSNFISELRELRTPEHNLLRDWETKRTGYVIDRLRFELLKLGVSEIAAAKIIELAKPEVRRPTARWPNAPARDHGLDAALQGSRLVPQDQFRRYMHDVLDRLSDAELRELRIPAGAAFEAALRSRR